tara:strand:+ start:26816 stop:27241 length:426 start_codon:yes stop_codon:yes gene_type:complete
MIHLPFVKLDHGAQTPRRGSDKAAGLDLYASKGTCIPGSGKALINTGIAVRIPSGHYGRIAPRSGFSWHNHTNIGAGVIDEDYRGELKILVFNHSCTELEVKKGERIAQLVLERCSLANAICVESLDKTSRESGSFGSTGV